jgi:hypothetical protein
MVGTTHGIWLEFGSLWQDSWSGRWSLGREGKNCAQRQPAGSFQSQQWVQVQCLTKHPPPRSEWGGMVLAFQVMIMNGRHMQGERSRRMGDKASRTSGEEW